VPISGQYPCGFCGQVGTLPRQPVGVIFHLGSEVSDGQDLVMRPHALDQVLEIGPAGPLAFTTPIGQDSLPLH
jgi:hypothetical protein